MARTNAPYYALNRGEVSKITLARADVERLRMAADCQVNFSPYVVGPMELRQGQQYIGGVRGDLACQIVDFVYASDDTALFELTDSNMRVWINDALLTRPSVTTAVSDPAFVGGGSWSTADTTSDASATIGGGSLVLTCAPRGGLARAKQAISVTGGNVGIEHGLRFVVVNGPVTVRAGSAMGKSDYIADTILDSGTHSLSLVPGGTINLQIESTDARSKSLSLVNIESAGVVTIPTPWVAADLSSLRWDASGDIVYVAAYGKQQYKIERRGVRPQARGFSVAVYRSDNGPFSSINTTSTKLTTTVMEGNGTITSDQPLFSAGHVGALVRLFTDGQTNLCDLGGGGVYSEPIRTSGLGNDRIFGWNVSGSWLGTLTLQRSVTSADGGFVDVATTTTNGLLTQDDTASYNNVICWYRVGFKPGDYTSGAASVFFGQTVASNGATVGPTDISSDGTFTTALSISSARSGAARIFQANISGIFVATVSLQQSMVGPSTGWVTIATAEGGLNTILDQINDGVVAAGAWYRLGIETGKYTSGTATLGLALPGLSSTGGSPTNGAAALSGGRYGIARITAYNSPTSVNIEVIEPFSSLSSTSNWSISDWSDADGWPTAPAFHEGRLWWLGAKIWGSQSNNYAGYAQADGAGQTFGDASAIIETFGQGPADRINWGLPLTRLLCGRERSVASIRSSSFDEPLTPTNFSVKDCSEQGASRLPAVKIGKRGIFVQQSGRRVYELLFDASAMDYSARDLTRLNLDIGKPGFSDIAVAVQPDKSIFLPRTEGQVACLLYDPEDQVECWWRIMTLGVIERVRVLPSPSSIEDSVYFVVRRAINGTWKRFIEKLSLRSDCVGGAQNKQLDSFVTYSGAATNTITLAHLPNTLVSVWADGVFIGTGTTNGSGVLSPLPDGLTHSKMVAGLAGAVETAKASAGRTITQMTGLSAYEGYPCEVFADQQPSGQMRHVGTLTVVSGTITLPGGWAASSIVAMFGFVGAFMSAKLAYGAQLGTALTQRKRVDHIGLVLFDAGLTSLKSGARFDVLDALPAIEGSATIPAGTVWSQYDAAEIELPGEWDTDARICLLAQAPNPVKVGGIVLSMMTSERSLPHQPPP